MVNRYYCREFSLNSNQLEAKVCLVPLVAIRRFFGVISVKCRFKGINVFE